MANTPRRTISYGGWLLAAASVIGFLLALYYLLDPDTGVAYSYGAIIVACSSAILSAAALIMVLIYDKPVWIKGILYVGMFIDLIGTGFAAYFLEAWWLLAAMAVGLIGWLIRVFFDPSDRQLAHDAIRREVMSS